MSWYEVRNEDGTQAAISRSKRWADRYAARISGYVRGPFKREPRDEDVTPARRHPRGYRARRNPGVPVWVWLVGGAAVVGAGVFFYQQAQANAALNQGTPSITLTAGQNASITANTATNVAFPPNSSNENITGADGQAHSVPLNVPAGTYKATWTDSSGTAQSVDIVAG
jgi:hypothetical protein